MKNIKSISLLTILILCLASTCQADTKSLTFLTAGSAFDLITTLKVLGPNIREGNPILSFGGKPGLTISKVAITSAVIIGLKSISRSHLKISRALGYIGGTVFTSIAIHNLKLK